MPNSPKLTLVPPLAAPARFGWCCLRCLTLRGTNTTQPSPLPVSVWLVPKPLVGVGATLLVSAAASALASAAARPASVLVAVVPEEPERRAPGGRPPPP